MHSASPQTSDSQSPSCGRVRERGINAITDLESVYHAVAVGDGYGAIEGAPPPTAYREGMRLQYRMCENDDIKEVYGECKGTGFDVKAVRQLVRMRKQDQAERQEAEAILDLYKAALGMA